MENEAAVNSETLFCIDSVTKVLTAAAVLKMAHEGTLDLQAPIQKYLPDYPVSREGEFKLIDFDLDSN